MTAAAHVRSLSLLCLCLLGAAPALAEADAKKIKQANRVCIKAERAMKSGMADKAKELFAEALEVQPGFPTAHLGLGHIAMGTSAFDVALQHYRAARDHFDDFSSVLMDVQAKRYSNARTDISNLRDRINNLQQNSTGMPNNLSFQLENQIARLQVIEPPDRDAAGRPPAEYDFYIGNALFQLDDLAGAVDAWERCRDANPKFAMVYNNLALAYWKQGRLDEAVAALDTAGELGFPVNPDFKRDLAEAAAKG